MFIEVRNAETRHGEIVRSSDGVSFNPPRPGVDNVQLLQNRNAIPLETAGQLIFKVVEK